jgi:hypothetical protein
MPGTRRKAAFIPPNERLFTLKPRRAAPFQFVLDAIAELPIRTRSMFGCLAVYVADKIVLILRDRLTEKRDNGVWLATSPEHHESLRREFPNMRTIYLLGDKITNWQNLPVDAPDFEQSALRVCDLILARDPRIGKAPKRKRSSRA